MTMPVHEVVHHGWLVKSPPDAKDRIFGSLIKKPWKKRYFVLTYTSPLKKASSKKNQSRGSITHSINSINTVSNISNLDKLSTGGHTLELVYYESDNMQRLQGSIDLMRCEEVLSHLESALFKHVFAIKTFHRSNRPRTYYLVTACEQEMLTWVGHLTTYLRFISENGAVPSLAAASITNLCKPLQRQPSTISTHIPSTINSHYASANHHSTLSYASTITNHHSSSTNNLDPKFLQNGLASTLNRKNIYNTENSPSLHRGPFLKRMNSVTQQSERSQGRLMDKLSDNSPHNSRNNSQYPLCPPQLDFHAFLPLLTHNNSTLPRSRAQCQAEERMALYDRPPSQKAQHCFFHNVHNLMKQHNSSIDRRKLNTAEVYDVPLCKHLDTPPSNPLYDLPPLHPSHLQQYDIPASLKTASNRAIYDTPEPNKTSLLSTNSPFYTDNSSQPQSSQQYISDVGVYNVPLKTVSDH